MEAKGRVMGRLAQAFVLTALLALAGCDLPRREETACAPGQRRSPVTEYCLPRWLSLRSNEVMARRGPGRDYPALWTYRSRGLPVQVVAETAEWRRICDQDGGAVWVHRSVVDGNRRVLSPAGTPTPLLSRPQAGARTAALMNPRAIGELDRCEDGWCRVTVGNVSGWAPQARLWGVAVAPQCR
jgi:SH3-like domain-containing protein